MKIGNDEKFTETVDYWNNFFISFLRWKIKKILNLLSDSLRLYFAAWYQLYIQAWFKSDNL